MPTLCPYERKDGMKISPTKLEYEMGKRLMTADALSKASGVSTVTISNIRRGVVKSPYPKTVKALAEALHCEPVDLLEEPE